MSWFSSPTPQDDVQTGRQAIVVYHNRAIYNSGYNETVDTLLSKIAKGKSPQYFLEGFGGAIREIDMSSGQINDAMNRLATVSGNRIPTQESFFKALSDRVSNPTFIDYVGATPEVIGQSALDVVHGAQEIGDSVLSLGKGLLQFGPILIFAAIVFIGYAKTRQIAGK